MSHLSTVGFIYYFLSFVLNIKQCSGLPHLNKNYISSHFVLHVYHINIYLSYIYYLNEIGTENQWMLRGDFFVGSLSIDSPVRISRNC